mmetsp:Transcript_1639/g.3705  ORF Transcript_1639/g.3705 Transcript_1639/m.3705 type:complete len:251 (-) Transcript_1639:946-1698(-)
MVQERSAGPGVRATSFRPRRGNHVSSLMQDVRARARYGANSSTDSGSGSSSSCSSASEHLDQRSDQQADPSGHIITSHCGSEDETPTSSLENHTASQVESAHVDHQHAAASALGDAPKTAPMWSAIIRVYENRFVRVSVMKDQSNPPAGNAGQTANTARALALSTILASVAAFVPQTSVPLFRPASHGRLSRGTSASRGTTAFGGSVLALCHQRLNTYKPLSGTPRTVERKGWGLAALMSLYEAVETFVR